MNTRAVFLALLVFATVVSAQNEYDPDHGHDDELTDWGIVIVCGLNHSSATIFAWKHRESNNSLPYIHRVSEPVTVRPGIASLAAFVKADGTPTPELNSETADYFAPLTYYLREAIDEDMWEDTPIYLKASDGLRDLDRQTQLEILDSTRNFFMENTSFPFKNEWFTTITTGEEAIYHWLAVNMLGNRFELRTNATVDTWVSVSMAGDDMWLGFENHDSKLYNYTVDLRQPNHMAKIYHLYANRFSGYGVYSAYHKFAEFLVSGKPSNELTQTNPCLFTGDQQEFTSKSGVKYTFIGTGDWSYCWNAISTTFDVNANCTVWPCSFDGIYTASLDDLNIIAHGDMALFIDMVLPNSTPQNNTGNFSSWSTDINTINMKTADLLVNHTWAQIDADARFAGLSEDQKSLIAFGATYVSRILNDGFGILRDDLRVHYSNNLGVNNTQIDPALGAMFYEVTQLEVVPSSGALIAASCTLVFASLFHLLF